MKRSNKVIAVVLSLVLLLTAVGGTLAWLTDKDSKQNVFTVGNIDIEVAGNEPKVTAYYIDEHGNAYQKNITISATATEENGKTTFNGLVPGTRATLRSNIVNVGKSDAYVRVAVVMNNVFEMNQAIDDYFKNEGWTDEQIDAIYDEMFNNMDAWGMRHDKASDEPVRMWLEERTGNDNYLFSDMAVKVSLAEDHSKGYYRFSPTNKFTTAHEDADNGDGTFEDWEVQDGYYENAINYNERIYVFYLKLSTKDSSNEFANQYALFNWIKVPTCFDNANMAAFEGLEVGIYADAIQVDGFADEMEAFQALEDQHPLGWWNK